MKYKYASQEFAASLGIQIPSDEQALVIEAPLSPGVVIAGAGSGKTETMSARVLWLVHTGQVLPAHILGLTFSKKAAA
jgi:DNA helicase-2/ATP-dependent DNA helicase PcrA